MTGSNPPRKPKPRTTLRQCMCCEKDFRSEGKHNRLCKSCKHGPYVGGVGDNHAGFVTSAIRITQG